MSRHPEAKWYAARVMNSHLASACVEMRALGFLAYVPHETVERRLGRTLRPKSRPVWPGYVFVHCDLNHLGLIGDIEGVSGFVRAMTTVEVQGKALEVAMPIAVPPNALAPVVLAEVFGDLDYTKSPEAWKAQRGDRVRVKSGKWKGYLGRILSVAKRKAIMELEGGIGFGKLTVNPDDLETYADPVQEALKAA